MNPGSVQASLTGAWRLMATARPDGLRLMDVSADGFWNSFLAIPVALPATLVAWLANAREIDGSGEDAMSMGEALIRIAIADLSGWILPLILIALVARPFGMSSQYAPLVVAYNWGSALMSWLVLPAVFASAIWPEKGGPADAFSLLVMMVSLVLGWRLTHAVLQRDAVFSIAFYVLLTMVSLMILTTLYGAFGLVGQI